MPKASEQPKETETSLAAAAVAAAVAGTAAAATAAAVARAVESQKKIHTELLSILDPIGDNWRQQHGSSSSSSERSSRPKELTPLCLWVRYEIYCFSVDIDLIKLSIKLFNPTGAPALESSSCAALYSEPRSSEVSSSRPGVGVC